MKYFMLGILLSLTMGVVCPQSIFAGDSAHGGDGIERNGKLYLRDLVEAGIYGKPYFEDQSKYSINLAQAISAHIRIFQKPLDLEVSKRISAKLTEIFNKSSLLEYLLKRTLFKYRWASSEMVLADPGDQESIFDKSKIKVIQLAIRRLNRITIYETGWSALDLDNQAALILHEITYALFDGLSQDSKINFSPTTRLFISTIFSSEFGAITRAELGNEMILANAPINIDYGKGLVLEANEVIVGRNANLPLIPIVRSPVMYMIYRPKYFSDSDSNAMAIFAEDNLKFVSRGEFMSIIAKGIADEEFVGSVRNGLNFNLTINSPDVVPN